MKIDGAYQYLKAPDSDDEAPTSRPYIPSDGWKKQVTRWKNAFMIKDISST